jgi:hypothetical protein
MPVVFLVEIQRICRGPQFMTRDFHAFRVSFTQAAG